MPEYGSTFTYQVKHDFNYNIASGNKFCNDCYSLAFMDSMMGSRGYTKSIKENGRRLQNKMFASIAVCTIVIPDVLSAQGFVVFCHAWPGILRV
jgi:hypothetical protein